jgi:Peptidase family M23
MIKMRYISALALSILFCWIAWASYSYFFDTTLPSIKMQGINNDCHYCSDIQCSVSSNKTGDISIWLDNQPLINKFKFKATQQEYPFIIPTKTISNGSHQLKTELVDTTFNKNKTVMEHAFYVDNKPLQAALIKPDTSYKVFQGRTLHIQLQTNKEINSAKISTLAQEYKCFPESKNSLIYECFIPISCEEQPNEYLFSVDIIDKVGNTLHLDNKFQVVMYPFKKKTLQISPEKIKQEEELGIDNKKFEKIINEIINNSPQEKLWRGTFCTPIDIERISCEFGTIRTTQHKGRYAHKALDVINTPKSVVWAPQDGVIVLKERFAFSGNTIVIDHGWGVLSLFFHLDDFANIAVNEKIKKGNPVGTIGKTGYATGYHLHWEMRIGNIPIDPMQWTKTTF